MYYNFTVLNNNPRASTLLIVVVISLITIILINLNSKTDLMLLIKSAKDIGNKNKNTQISYLRLLLFMISLILIILLTLSTIIFAILLEGSIIYHKIVHEITSRSTLTKINQLKIFLGAAFCLLVIIVTGKAYKKIKG